MGKPPERYTEKQDYVAHKKNIKLNTQGLLSPCFHPSWFGGVPPICLSGPQRGISQPTLTVLRCPAPLPSASCAAPPALAGDPPHGRLPLTRTSSAVCLPVHLPRLADAWLSHHMGFLHTVQRGQHTDDLTVVSGSQCQRCRHRGHKIILWSGLIWTVLSYEPSASTH